MPIESTIPLAETDRAILRAVLTREPKPGSAATEPCSEPADALASALTAAGLDALDLPLWFAQPHIQHYIQARRALDDFLDEPSTRAARREGLELLRLLPSLTRAQHSASAASRPVSDPSDPGADAPPSEPTRARSLKELRLIATALLRAGSTPRQTASRSNVRVARPRHAPTLSDSASQITDPNSGERARERSTVHPAEPPRKPEPFVPSPEDLEELPPEEVDGAALERALQWALSLVATDSSIPPGPEDSTPTGPDTS
ncbi:MAG: hypothetical protein H6811_09745 [Phycisphaeraceae bacterium]|nr:hypothetical protein [Phycisphaeraceae bacterium]